MKNFSIEALEVLSDYFRQLEIEFDLSEIADEYTEYANIAEFQKSNVRYSEYKTFEDIEQATLLIAIDDERFIIQDF